MGNYIKIPLAINPPRSFAAAITIAPGRLSGGGNIASGTASPATATTVAPVGASGATFTGVATGTAIGDMTLTISAAGEGYKVGDVITVAPQAGGGQTTWDADITFTVIAADLVTSEGSTTNDYQLFDVDKLLVVDGFSTSINMWQNINSLETGVTPQNIKLNLDNAPTIDFGLALRAVADAMVKAIQSPNSLPIVDWGNSNVEVLSVTQE